MPDGYKKEGIVWKLNKSIYGLKQSGKNWNSVIDEFLKKQNFIKSEVDPCVYLCNDKVSNTIVLIWVDDIVIASSSMEGLMKVKQNI